MKSHSHFIGSSGVRGFTLIELMVVIAIIAILAAIMFPVFNRARDKAMQTTCIQNQRSLVQGVLIYVGDHSESFPMKETWAKDIGLAAKVFDCPASTRDGSIDEPDYSYNANLSRVSIGDLGAAHATEVTIDGPGLNQEGNASVTALMQGEFRHNDTIVISYADGHVAVRKANQALALGAREMAPYALGMMNSDIIRCYEYDDQETLRADLGRVFNNQTMYLSTFPNVLEPLGGQLREGQWHMDGLAPPAATLAKFFPPPPSPQPTGFGGPNNFHLVGKPGLGPVRLMLDFDIAFGAGASPNEYFRIDGDSSNDSGGAGWGTNDPPRASDGMRINTLVHVWNQSKNGLEGTNVVFGGMGNPNKTGDTTGVTPIEYHWGLCEAHQGVSYQISPDEGAFTGGVVDFIADINAAYGYARNTDGNPMYGDKNRYTGNRPLKLYALDIVLVTRDGRSFSFKGFTPAPHNENNCNLIFGRGHGLSGLNGTGLMVINAVSRTN